MPGWITFIIVLAGASIGWAIGLIQRAKSNPDLQGKGLKVLIVGKQPKKKE